MLPTIFRVTIGLFLIVLGAALIFGGNIATLGQIPQWFLGVLSFVAGACAWANI